MEKLTILLPESTVDMLHLLARDSGQTLGKIIQDMALDRYMQDRVVRAHMTIEGHAEPASPQAPGQASR
ncbi:hypothetical protein [Celeribacter neptunius]|uniref:Uncharacterized protein n=1 Tax=Celeribacter neptunius TaxID=588602 RepID=A0A1I3WQZ4_9RHOB|nr:hypothetical protein [Celeribacter neptunius]SFK09872.1 hypothetical protein SAMN04487991_3804 [Celeribacter neptunius]